MLVKTLKKPGVPEEKNIIFVSPELSKWPCLLIENKRVTENLPNRLESRMELLTIGRNYTQKIMGISCPNDIPESIIATGHQAIWYHCGIWAKDLTAATFAKAVNGCSLHLVIDHDIRDTAMVLPKQNADESWHFERIEIEGEHKTAPLEFRPLQQERMKTFVDAVIEARAGQFCSDIWSRCTILEDNKTSRFSNVAELITYFQAVLNAELGLNIIYLPVSGLSQSNAFVNFVVSIMQDAADFAAVYNQAITRHINERKINPEDTIQRLSLDKTTCSTELPFWMVSPQGKRESLHVTSNKTNENIVSSDTDELGILDSASLNGKTEQLKNMLTQRSWRLRPKAVSLTLFARLFLADWFVHGIGGSLYELVTDYIIENYYTMEPLRFGVATCTMTLPLPDAVVFAKDNITRLKHELHNIKHNPEKYIDESIVNSEPVVSLVERKKDQIALAKNPALPGSLRKSAWNSLSEINEKLFEYAKDTAKMLEKKIVEFEKSTISQKVCNWREYFFGLFPEEKLREVVESLTFTECG